MEIKENNVKTAENDIELLQTWSELPKMSELLKPSELQIKSPELLNMWKELLNRLPKISRV